MGCNTLSSKTPDKRSIEEYVEVLIKNGFPRDLAERLHGFASTGPLGKVAAPLLKKALRDTSAQTLFSKGPDTKKLNQLLAGSNSESPVHVAVAGHSSWFRRGHSQL